MLVSVFTPTHSSRYLVETWASVKDQEGVPWEWVVVPNGDIDAVTIQQIVENDSRVRICPYPGILPRTIGNLKRFACEHSKGDVLVELDHDDLLAPGILHKIADKVSEGAGFVYSDAAYFQQKRESQEVEAITFNEHMGWEHYDCEIRGLKLRAAKAFPATARSLCEIYFAPDHVRAWARSAYDQVGGHNPALLVCDDHELIIRTYLQGISFVHINEPGYVYRNFPEQSFRRFNDEIQKKTRELRDTHLPALVQEWISRNFLPQEYLSNEESIDLTLTRWAALESNSIGAIYSRDVLHQLDQGQVLRVFQEGYRLLAPGGWFLATVPAASSASGQVFTAKTMWSTQAFRYFCEEAYRKTLPIRDFAFQNVVTRLFYPSTEHQKEDLAYVFSALCALKGQRQPGAKYVQPPVGCSVVVE